MSVPGYTVYRYFLATKIHFTTESYNVIKSSGNISASEESYANRSDQGVFEKIGKRYKTDKEVVQFLIANFAYGNTYVVFSLESHQNYIEWTKRKHSITQVVSSDIETLSIIRDEMGINPYSIESGIPMILKSHLSGQITYETMVILQGIVDYLSIWESNILLWHDIFLRIRKGQDFVKYDKGRIKTILDQEDWIYNLPK